MTRQEDQIRRIVDMRYIWNISLMPLPDGGWEGAFRDSDGFHVSRTEGDSIEMVLDLLEEKAIEHKDYKRREERRSK